jgi:hypothetical protein
MCVTCANAAVAHVEDGDPEGQERGQPIREQGILESVFEEVVRSAGLVGVGDARFVGAG